MGIKETKEQGEISKNKTAVPLQKATGQGRRREGATAVRAQLETQHGREAQGAQTRAAPAAWPSLPGEPRPAA